jgi:hypothetical protein
METVFKCSRCGYENASLYLFKKHFQRKTECKPKLSNIPLVEVKEQFLKIFEKKTISPSILPEITKVPEVAEDVEDIEDIEDVDDIEDSKINKVIEEPEIGILIPTTRSPSPTSPERKKRRKKLRNFGDECREYIKKENLKDYIQDPLKGIQDIIKMIYFNEEHPENHVVRSVINEPSYIQIHREDTWLKRPKKYIYDKMIYFAYGIMEYNINKKSWTDEFKNFIVSMGEMDNDDLLELIRDEVDETVCNSEKQLAENSDDKNL